MITADDALVYCQLCVSRIKLTIAGTMTYMQAMLRIPTTAYFAWRFICNFLTRKIGRIPTVKSHMAANTL